MFAFVLRRLLLMIPTTFGIALVVFLLYQAAPGDPATVMLGISGGGELGTDSDLEARVDAFKRRYGLDRSLPVQFLNYIGPFNLNRDGHPWFSSPATERKTEELELPDGSRIVEGQPLAIPALSEAPAEVSAATEAASQVLVDDEAGELAWNQARETLVEAGVPAYPAIFSRLYELRDSSEVAAPALRRLFGTL